MTYRIITVFYSMQCFYERSAKVFFLGSWPFLGEMTGYTWQIYRHFCRGANFCDLLFTILHTSPLLEKGSTLKGKNLLWEQILYL